MLRLLFQTAAMALTVEGGGIVPESAENAADSSQVTV